MKFTRILKAATFLAAVMVAPAQSPPATPAPELKHWDLWVGDWTLKGTAKDGPTQPEYQVNWRLQGQRILGGHFVQVDSVWNGSGAEQRWLEVLSYDPVTRTHAGSGYASNGVTWVIAATFDGARFVEDGTTTTPDGKIIKWRNRWDISADRTAVSGVAESEQAGARWTSFTVNGTKAAASTPPVVEGKVSVDGIELPYLVEGTGIPCLVINNRVAMRRALSADLRKTFRFAFAEMRPLVPYRQTYALANVTLDTFLDDIERVRMATGFEKVCVFGHSIFGLLAYEYARKYPQHVTHVIMNGTPAAWNDRHQALVRGFWASEASAERKAVLEQNVARLKAGIASEPVGRQGIATYLMNTPQYFFDPRYDAAWLFEGEHWSPELLNHLFGVVMKGYDISTRPPPPAPIFLALGRHDYAVPYTCWDEIKGQIPGLSYHVFDRSGHYPPLEEPELFDARLLEWIKRR